MNLCPEHKTKMVKIEHKGVWFCKECCKDDSITEWLSYQQMEELGYKVITLGSESNLKLDKICSDIAKEVYEKCPLIKRLDEKYNKMCDKK